MYSEADIEKMVIDTIVANGWKYVSPDDLPREHGDVMVESMVKSALIRLNPVIKKDPAKADEVIYKLRSLILTVQSNNLITQNEAFKKLIFEENSFPFEKDGKFVSIKFFATDPNELDKNEYIVTNQWIYPRVSGGKRLDIVLLINGFPVSIGEIKTPFREAISWIDGANDILAYEKSIPQMFVTNIFNFATEGKCYRYSSINAPIEVWGPWHIGDGNKEGTLELVSKSINTMIRPEVIMDIFRFFTLFATDKKFRKYKVICRYQQYEATNLIVKRVIEGRTKQGLIWHFQGSGKSLLMVFAAQKLRMTTCLNNPTVVIVDDRIDLDTQMTATFNASNIPNLTKASSKEELITFFKTDQRKILITTIFKFGEVNGILNSRDNIILMCDEAHRTQEGDLGRKMHDALPNAFFFGLTGTPINRIDKNTFKNFGATVDKSGYLSRYSFSDSIRDGATLPLLFEPVPVDLHINKEIIDKEYERIVKEAGLSDEEKKQLTSRVNIEALMKAPERIQKVCQHIANHFMEKINPEGLKAQVVCYDRECCVLYKNELDKLLGEYTSTIVMDTNNDKEDKYIKWRRDRDEEAKVIDQFRDPNNPLKIVIVTSKLLTGFDAPILQVMYLDKPMKDHTLLQAVCRTNRTYGQGKTHGLIVDYIGIFDDVAKALDFDDQSVKQVVTNIGKIKEDFPNLLNKCLEYFIGVDRTIEGWEGLMAAQESLKDNKERDRFGADYRVLNRAWNILSPDMFLSKYQSDYRWLSKVYDSIKPVDGRGALIWASLGPKTLELVHQNISVSAVHETPAEEIIRLDSELIDQILEPNQIKRKTKEVEISLAAQITKHADDPRFIELGRKLEELREKHEQGLIKSIEFLKTLLEYAKEAVDLEKLTTPKEEIDKGIAALTKLFTAVKNRNTPIIVERIVNDIDGVVKLVRFPGWQDTTTGRREVKKALRSIIRVKYKITDPEVFNKAYAYVEQYY